jgi:peptide/nickel transport system ATP-binding protein
MRALRGRDIGIVFQEPMTALNPVLPIGRQVGEALTAHAPGTPRRQVRDRVVEALEAVSIPRAAERLADYPHQFSGGQRQRILIAMALMNRPRLLIADEPTTALDVTVQAQILELLAGLRRRYSLSLLFISHDLAVVASVADRVLVLRQGEVLEEGSRQQLFSNPLHAYTRSLLGAVPTLETDRERPLATLDAATAPGGVLREREPGHWVRGLP